MEDANELYKQVYLFFLKRGARELVLRFIKHDINLIFNRDSLVIKTRKDSYIITITVDNEKKYWFINSNNYCNKVICKNGNLDKVFKLLYKKDNI